LSTEMTGKGIPSAYAVTYLSILVVL